VDYVKAINDLAEMTSSCHKVYDAILVLNGEKRDLGT
jgi:hypothetical protein